MTPEEIITEIRHLPLDARRAIFDTLSREIYGSLDQQQPRGLSAELRGILRPDGPLPTDEEMKRDYRNYLESKYS